MRASFAPHGLSDADAFGIVSLLPVGSDTRSGADDEISLGTAVRLSLASGRARSGLTEEGVVIEVVPPGARVRSARVACPLWSYPSRSTAAGYVVQCWDRRVLRQAREMRIVSL